jgi:hypothetical protein
MTVQELIDELNKLVNKNIQVAIETTGVDKTIMHMADDLGLWTLHGHTVIVISDAGPQKTWSPNIKDIHLTKE